MIYRIETSLYKASSFRKSLGQFQALTGNDDCWLAFADAALFVRDLMSGLTQAVSARALPNQALTPTGQSRFEIALTMIPPLQTREFPQSACRYEICVDVSCHPARLIRENFWVIQDKDAGKSASVCNRDNESIPPGWERTLLADTDANGNMVFLYAEGEKATMWVEKQSPDQPALALAQDPTFSPTMFWAYNFLTHKVIEVFLSPGRIKLPSRNHFPEIILFKEDLLALIARMKKHFPRKYQQWDSWITCLYPEFMGCEIQDNNDATGPVIQIKNQQLDSKTISDEMWTAMSLLLLPHLSFNGHFLLINRPDDYMHPSRLMVVMQLLASLHNCQVVIALGSSEATAICEKMQDWAVLHLSENS